MRRAISSAAILSLWFASNVATAQRAAQPDLKPIDVKVPSRKEPVSYANEITDMIAGRLAQAPATSANRMLREFRDAGLACEQHRFTR